MTAAQIYQNFRIPLNLQRHMFRVAAVGEYLTDHWLEPIDSHSVVTTLLLHDLGNLLKFDLSRGLELFDESERDLEYWTKVRSDLEHRYSSDEHIATQMMAREIDVSERVLYLLGNMGSSHLSEALNSHDWELKITVYSDFRVDPHGFVSVKDRFDDIIKRYRGGKNALADIDVTLQKRDYCLELEEQLQPKLDVALDKLPNGELESKSKLLKARSIV